MAIVQSQEPKRLIARSRWIISARDDMVWFIGSVVTSYGVLGLWSLGVSPVILVLGWALLFDGTHFFATLSRTYFDREERRLRPGLLWGSLAFFGVGPLLYLAGHGNLFFLFAVLWAYHHLVKQQYGFMVLYKKKNHDLAPVDNTIDRAFLLLGLWYPFVDFTQISTITQALGFQAGSFGTLLQNMLWWALVVSATAFGARQLQKVVRGEALDVPKQLLLAAAIPMHWAVFALVPPRPFGYLLATPALTIFHNIQYHRLVWFYNHNTYRVKPDVQRHGWATLISRRLSIYGAAAFASALAYQLPRYLLFPGEGRLSSLFWGYTFIHYFLDGKIWRVRHDPQLDEGLRTAVSPG